MTQYTIKDYNHLLKGDSDTALVGLSDTMLANHLTLYKGYVDNANKLYVKLDGEVESGSVEYYEIKRRIAWEIDGMKMHEYYFDNLTKKTTDNLIENEIGKNTKEILEKNFGNIDNWKKSFITNCMIRGIGWVMLLQDNKTKEVFHAWIGEHNVGHILDCKILLVMDMWEHAYMTDYGIKKADYIEAFIKNINWNMVESRM